MVTCVLARELCLFFWRDEAVGLQRLSMLLALLIDWPVFFRFWTLAAFLSGEVDKLGFDDSELRNGTDFTIWVLRGSMSAKFTCQSDDIVVSTLSNAVDVATQTLSRFLVISWQIRSHLHPILLAVRGRLRVVSRVQRYDRWIRYINVYITCRSSV